MKKNTVMLLILVLALLVLFASSHVLAQAKKGAVKSTPKTVDLRLVLRDLWVGHIFWVRNVVLTTKLADAAAAKTAEEQALQNAKNIANSITPYYGKEAADKLFNLLAGHYGAIKEYMTAVYAGDKQGADAARNKLLKNGEEIATFLSSANPNWSKEALLSALAAHAGHHIAQIEAINTKNWPSEAQTCEDMKNHIYKIADVLADGIVKQFPAKF